MPLFRPLISISSLALITMAAACSENRSSQNADAGSEPGPDSGAEPGPDSGNAGSSGNASGGSSGSAGNAGAGGSSAGSSNHAGSAGTPSDAGSDPDAGPSDPDAGHDPDGGDPGEAPSVEACLDAATAYDLTTEVLSFSAPGLAVGLVRYIHPEYGGTSGTRAWFGARFAFAAQGFTECIGVAESVMYMGTYHNYNDSVTIVAGDATYTLAFERVGYEEPYTVTITKTEGDTTVLEPTELVLTGCYDLAAQSDCLEYYAGTFPMAE